MKICRNLLLLFFVVSFLSCKPTQLTEIESRYILKGKDKLYLVNLIRENQKNGILGSAPALQIENNFITYSTKKLEEINISKDQIRSLKIMSSEKSIALLGKLGKDGYILISTTGKQKTFPEFY
ncbi:hypothetical protein ACFSJW_11420 [Flavobacterium artemisiae]|uniref:Lipoprotein n=1 Tax=Flavobacterium artemisiae TaxID=2126556 RepID=A0ABW4HF90_9FLAO